MASPRPPMPPVTSAILFGIAMRGSLLGYDLCEGLRTVTLAFDRERDAHAAADAQTGKSLLGITANHLVQQRHQDAAARCADRMPNGNGTAIYVDLRCVPAHLTIDAYR